MKHIRNYRRAVPKSADDTDADPATIAHIKALMPTVELAVSIQLFGLLFLLYGTPIGKLCMLTLANVHTEPTGTAITVGSQPAALADVFVPLLLAHLNEVDRRTATNVARN